MTKAWTLAGICLICTILPVFARADGNSKMSQQEADTSALDATLSPLLQKAISDGSIPGAVIVVGHSGHVVYHHAFGFRSLEPKREPMTEDTIFDLASLTKCIATTTSVMKLVEQGRIRLNDPVSVYLPEFAQNGKDEITVRELLTHYSGLPPDLDLKASWTGRDTAYRMAMEVKPTNPSGTRFVYSDINFETLGFLVEKITGTTLNAYARTNIFLPLGMRDTDFLPSTERIARIAPTQYDERARMLRGEVHDPTARRMGGVAGHAGLFSTAGDLSIFAEELLSGSKVMKRATVEKMTTPQQPATATTLRGLGWDIDSPFSTNRGELLPVGSYGHTGFTGTSMWIDPTTNTYIILLTNAVHPNGHGSVVSLRARVATAVISTLNLSVSEQERLRQARITGYNESLMASRRITIRNGIVKSGIDVLEAHEFRELKPDVSRPLRVGLIANQTSVDSEGRRTADILTHAAGVRLAAIFSPEHGIAGKSDSTEIQNSTDTATGVPVYSVYGNSDQSRRPTHDALAGVDVLIYDIQDVGVRFYTYESTLGYFLEAAAEAGRPIVVLDRPNPINGTYVQGPVADDGRESFVSYWKTPVRHGMTTGELAQMFNQERGIHAKLTVIAMEGWLRGDWFDSTGTLWINPSPNMRSLNEAMLYPGIGMIETTNISVGRGTETPFEVVGAPWIRSTELARYLNAREISGVRFVPVEFTPKSAAYANEKCGGINLVITDRNALDAPELGAEIVSALRTLYPSHYDLTKLDTLMVNRASLDALAAGQDPRRLAEQWQDAIDEFAKVRAKYLLYEK